MSRVSPCFLKMPARWPTSDTEVSQLPRWPIASFTASCADAAPPSSANASAQAMVLAFIILPPGLFFLTSQATRSRGCSLPPPSVRQLTDPIVVVVDDVQSPGVSHRPPTGAIQLGGGGRAADDYNDR